MSLNKINDTRQCASPNKQLITVSHCRGAGVMDHDLVHRHNPPVVGKGMSVEFYSFNWEIKRKQTHLSARVNVHVVYTHILLSGT
jgi:hypothetical protein